MTKDTDEVVARVLREVRKIFDGINDTDGLADIFVKRCDCLLDALSERAAALAPQEGEATANADTINLILSEAGVPNSEYLAVKIAETFDAKKFDQGMAEFIDEHFTPPAALAEPTVKNMNLFTGPGYIGPTHEPDISLAAAPAGAQPWNPAEFISKLIQTRKIGYTANGAEADHWTLFDINIAVEAAHAAGKAESGGMPDLDYTELLTTASRGYTMWAMKEHNKKWHKMIDGTPIINDALVCVCSEIWSRLHAHHLKEAKGER